jgi:RNA-directed DNA polymerase
VDRQAYSFARTTALGELCLPPGASSREAASLHCGCAWLIKLDVRRFFESISEIAAYRVFLNLGYQPLVAFELARICTRQSKPRPAHRHKQWQADTSFREGIPAYRQALIGHLPQGAPTSPMLSTLAMVALDEEVAEIAKRFELLYSRYADDFCLSTPDAGFKREDAAKVIGEVYQAMARFGLSPNRIKTKVCPPGSRKIVLGLFVDGKVPRLTREFRANIRRHIHYLRREDVGPVRHAEKRGFTSVRGLRNHIEGLISYARQINPEYATQCERELALVSWPF